MTERNPEVVDVGRDDLDARGHLADRLAASRREEGEVPDGDEQKKGRKGHRRNDRDMGKLQPADFQCEIQDRQPDRAKNDGIDERGEKSRPHRRGARLTVPTSRGRHRRVRPP